MEPPLYNFVVFDGFCYCVIGINLGESCSTSPQDLCVANTVCDSGTCSE